MVLASVMNIDVVICSNKSLSDSEYVDDIVLLSEDSRNLQVSIDRLNDSIAMFRMFFVPLKCEMLLQDQITSKVNPVLARAKLNEMVRFSYFGNCTPTVGRMPGKVSSRIHKAQLKFANLDCLWRWRDIRLSI